MEERLEVKYPDEETRDEYHKLETDLQVVVNQLEDKLAELGWMTEIIDVGQGHPLQIIIRISK